MWQRSSGQAENNKREQLPEASRTQTGMELPESRGDLGPEVILSNLEAAYQALHRLLPNEDLS